MPSDMEALLKKSSEKANQFEPVMNGKFDNLLVEHYAEALEAVDLALRCLQKELV